MKYIFWMFLTILLIISSGFGILYRLFSAGSLRAAVDALGYFTILANLFVFLIVVLALFKITLPRSWEFAAADAIVITALIYQLFLKKGLNLPPFSGFVGNLNHGLNTFAFVFWYWLAPARNSLPLKKFYAAIPFPALYLAYGTIEGLVKGRARYFFLDIGALGLSRYLFWLLALAGMFLAAGLLILAIDKALRHPQQ